ncbi:MAG: sigma-70 family RNA polymerase sigma factor [Candidatus Binatia bacterium]
MTAADYAALFENQRRHVWGLCYRMTGNAADADELVQETFLRAIERPPARTEDPWRPWLVRVAMNLARDLLRRRRRMGYRGTWLPSPIETEGDALPAYELPADSGSPTEGRYDLLESVSFAFLLALEALGPQQRAVLLLRDVFDYSVREAAEALGLSEPNVKTTHHRARKAMQAYERRRCIPTRDLQGRTRAALERFLAALGSQDGAALEAMLADDVRSWSDGGEFAAAHNVVSGRGRVLRLIAGLTRHRPPQAVEVRSINGLPAVLLDWGGAGRRTAPRGVLRLDVDADGRITALHTVLASRKLTAVHFSRVEE